MASMRDVAIDSNRFEQLCTDLQKNGFELLRAEPLADSNDELPIAWALIARKQ
jgi:hypothetical protein